MKKKIIVPILLLSSLLVTGCNNSASSSSDKSETSVELSTTEQSSETSQKESTTEVIESSSTTQESQPEESSSSTSEIEQPDYEGKKVHFNDSNPAAKKVSISSLMAKQLTAPSGGDGVLYQVTGTMQHVQNSKYGNFELTDDTGTMCVYGVSRYSSCITVNGNRYSFTNNQNFRDIGIDGGDIVTLEGIFIVYGTDWKTLEFQGYPVDGYINDLGKIVPKSYSEADPYTSGNYYDSINPNSSTLGTDLHNLMMNTHTNFTKYKEVSRYFSDTDDYGKGKAQCLYTGKTGSFNNEHVWPQYKSKDGDKQLFGTSYAGADMLHIRPTNHDANSKRGSTAFAPMFRKEALNKITRTTGGVNYYGAGTTSGTFEPADEIKGDIARIIAYVFMHYSNEFGGKQTTYTGKLYLNGVMAGSFANAKALIRLWNAEDPVDTVEIKRNNKAFEIQGNRNPFVDHPSFIDKVFSY